MAVNGINYANPYAGYVNYGGKNNSKSASLGCSGRGIICPPEIEEANRKKRAKVATAAVGLVGLGVLAFVFRGKIRGAVDAAKPTLQNGLETAKNYANKALEKGKDYATRAVKFAEPYVAQAKTAVINAWKSVKGFFTKAKV
jgi:hypothetical protein